MILAYARVSTADQDLAAQIAALTAAGADRVFSEKISGVKTDRPELAALLSSLQSGDTLLVTRLDRLARSTLDLLGILKRITDTGATFKSLADTWCDTTSAHGRLMITILGGLAEFERSLIKARTGEGRERARAAGKRLGGPRPENQKMNPDQKMTATRLILNGQTVKETAVFYNVCESTLWRMMRQYRAAEAAKLRALETPSAPCSPAVLVPAPN